MRKFALHNKHTHIIAVTPSHRYDLPDFSCVNKETQVFNRKLHKLLKDMQHVSVVDTKLTTDNFTRHGLHLNSSGEERIAKTIGQIITTLSTIGNPPISLNWKEVPLTAPNVDTKVELKIKKDDGVHKNAARSSCRPKRPPITRNEDFLMGNMHIKNSVVGYSVSSDNYTRCR
jgi:hypothetical protein